tara:strand:+ start:1757 stop:2464 length:708 start_codon:yes stop_codon:yes gene_type:complete
MPNHVYCGISLSDTTGKQKSILKQIEKVGGICRYYNPMPVALENTSSPMVIITEEEHKEQELKNKQATKDVMRSKYLTKKMSEHYIKLWGSNNWYEWALTNWNTKWGDYDFEIDDDVIKFTSAWSPIGEDIIEMFAKDFPSFHYWFEEETGWGGERDFEDGEEIDRCDYDEPSWEEIEEINTKDNFVYTITKLLEENPNFDDGIGYYLDYSNEFLGKTLKEAKESLINTNQLEIA